MGGRFAMGDKRYAIRDFVCEEDGDAAHEDGEEAGDVDGEGGVVIGECFLGGVDEEVFVVVDDAGDIETIVRIFAGDGRKVGGVYPKGEGSGGEIIERWLAAFLAREMLQGKGLHGQPATLCDVLDKTEMPLLIGRLEQRSSDTVYDAEEKKGGEEDDGRAKMGHADGWVGARQNLRSMVTKEVGSSNCGK